MRDEDKTKEELIQELVALRRQLSEATGQLPEAAEVHSEDRPGPRAATPEVSPGGKAGDPWQPIETKLVIWSVAAGMIAMIVLATLVHMFLLGGH
jgi:hypothetical protein